MATPDPDCPLCGGSGMVESDRKEPHPPYYERCGCVLRRDVLENVERGMKGLSHAPKIKTSPLLDRTGENLWITAGKEFEAHLRHVAVRQPASWFFRVTSDAELVTAWLATTALQGGEIIDPDAYMVSTKFLTIPDLVVPPDLVVIRMGIKVARNSAAPEVLAEAIQTRFHEGKPTWLWDDPGHPLNAGHLFWSSEVGRVLSGWDRVSSLDAAQQSRTPTGKPRKAKSMPRTTRKTLRGGGDQ